MKRILFVYPQMMMGGSTTSLLSLLNEVDTSKYDVSLLLSFDGGPYADRVPDYVHKLPWSYLYQDTVSRKLHRLFSPRYMIAKVSATLLSYLRKNVKIGWQYLEEKDVDFYRDVEEEYDVAVAFLEGQMCKYVAKHVKAKRKIAWVHVDYKASQFDPKYDRESMKCFDRIVLVSERCRDSFCESFPTLRDRAIIIENILSAQYLKMLSKEKLWIEGYDAGKINLITTCRISFSSKGLDRAVRAICRLKGNDTFERLSWYIIGDGNDRVVLEKMIRQCGMENTIHVLGMKPNPYPYLKMMQLFFLPSIREGKPMSVTEGFIMGLPALVTDYASAREQVESGITGLIMNNSEDGVYQGLKYILEHPEKIDEWTINVQKRDYSNREEITRVEQLLDGVL